MTLDGIRERLKAALFDNFRLKLLSLLFAVGFYAFLQGADKVQRTVAVPVVASVPSGNTERILMTPPPTQVNVILRGPRSQVSELRVEDLGSLQLDLRSHLSQIELNPSDFHVPAGITVEQIIPEVIRLRWDNLVTRPIPVQVARTGEIPQGFVVKGAISVEPRSVNATGPESIVSVTQYARTSPFDVTDLTEGTYQRSLPLDPAPELVTYDVATVVATIQIDRELIPRTFDRKVEVVGMPNAKTIPASVSVRIIGAPEDVNSLLPEAIVPRVEPKSAPNIDITQPGSAYLDVLVEVSRVKVDVNPPKVLVKW